MTKDPTSREIWARADIESPCVQLCVVHPETRLCIGCRRSLDEISAWTRMSPEDRRSVMEELPSREAAPKGRRGGRAARVKR